MVNNKLIQLFILTFTATLNVILSFIFGNQGYEAFLIVFIALGVVLTVQFFQFLKFIYTHNWPLLSKLLLTVFIIPVWVLFMGAIFGTIVSPVINPLFTIPNVNWLIVVLGLLPYIFTKISNLPISNNVTIYATNMTFTLISVVTLFFAIVTYYGVDSQFRIIALVLAIELQYIMNYIIINTGYIKWVNVFTNHIKNYPNSKLANINNLNLVLIGLPYFTPITLIALISVIN